VKHTRRTARTDMVSDGTGHDGVPPATALHRAAHGGVKTRNREKATNGIVVEFPPDPAKRLDPVERDRAPVVPLWARFDAEWYVHSHKGVATHMAELGLSDAEQYYREHGARLGHSPNMFFDEAWYLSQSPDVVAYIAANGAEGGFVSGFEHYCHDGYRGRSPHWLFSEAFYRAANPEVTQGLLERHGLRNGYDHYLSLGDRAFRSGHWFFDPMLYRQNKAEADRGGAEVGGSFAQMLDSGYVTADAARVSWYFDPVWYLAQYPEVADEIAAGRWTCALHHYLCNAEPQRFAPLEWFSESFYAATYPDVGEAVAQGHFRNGYEHFVRHGAAEARKPHPDIDLFHYFISGRVRADIEGGAFRDPFAHWLKNLTAGALGRSVEPVDERQSKQLFARAAESLLPQLARRGLDFSTGSAPRAAGGGSETREAAGGTGAPQISVIVVLHNQFALTMMALASLRSNFAGSLELIVVDSGSHDETRHIERYVHGARVIRFAYNAGFVEACNTALPHATAPALLYLNNDLLLSPGACQAALDRLFASPDTGAVGAKFIRTNGLLQEAGSIIWRDGSTLGYLRDADPNTPEANFVREVDFCSGAFLMLRTELVKQLGGFDDDYRPAYYEEADLCVRLRKAGWRILYDPAITIQHFEYGSADATASTRLMMRNHRIFTAKHMDYLRYQQPPALRNAVHARTPRPSGGVGSSSVGNGGGGVGVGLAPPRRSTGEHRRSLRILFIEDRIPLRRLGSGYVRSNDIIGAMSALGHLVSVFPIYAATASPIEIYRDMPETAEVLYERGLEALDAFIAERAGYYDIVWIGRTHNLERLLPILGNAASALPAHGFILDTEAIAAPRTTLQNQILGRAQTDTLEQALRRELACAYFCQKIIAVNEHDADLIRLAGHSNTAILGHMKEPAPTPATWSQRSGLLFLGAIHDIGSPNHDSLQWFVREVLPLLDDQLPPEVRFTVAGFVRPGLDLSDLGQHPRVDLAGPVDDLATLHDSHRLFIAPTRFAGGIPFKIHEAASYGLPTIATSLLCQQLGWTHNTDIINAGPADPTQFAHAITDAYSSPELWNTVRRGALKRLEAENSRDGFERTIEHILDDMAQDEIGQTH